MKLRPSPTLIRVVGPLLVRLLGATWRYRAALPDVVEAVRARHATVVIVLWHEELLPLLWFFRGYRIGVVVSEARDGQYLADAARQFGYLPIRGSSRRGASKALRGAIRTLQEGISVAFTPDGPVGPRRVLKPGAVAAAQAAGVPLYAIRADASRAWRFRSWDRFMLPKPFATISLRYAGPILIGDGDEELARGIREAGEALNLLGAA